MANQNNKELREFEDRFKEKEWELIGSGGFAEVYKAFDHAKHHYIAIKVAPVKPQYQQFTLQREVELVNKLSPHPNIARYDACYRFDFGIGGSNDYAILKFYEDGNLEQFLTTHKLSAEDNEIIVRGILRGISFLHNNNYIHRDLKAQNILLQREDGVWTPKITDFGLARVVSSNSTGETSKSIGFSWAYAAPEQIQNGKIYKNVDLWAVGVVIYRIIAGELPFKTDQSASDERNTQSQLELSRKIVNQELPEKLNTLPEPYQSIIKRCLLVDQMARVQSAEELLDMMNGEGPPLRGNIFANDEKTRMFPPYIPPDSPPTPVIPPRESIPSTDEWTRPSYDSVGQSVIEPMAVPPIHEYIPPRNDFTQIVPQETPQPKPPPPPVQPQVSVGEPRTHFNWLWVIVPVIIVVIGFATYWATNNRTTKETDINRGDKTTIKKLAQLENDNEAALGNNERLDEVARDLETYMTWSPNVYQPIYLLAKNRTYAGQFEDASLDLKKAALIAIERGQSNLLLNDINRDNIWKNWSVTTSYKNTVINALKSGDKTLIENLQ